MIQIHVACSFNPGLVDFILGSYWPFSYYKFELDLNILCLLGLHTFTKQQTLHIHTDH